MSKRQNFFAASTAGRRPKRQRHFPSFGAPVAEDDPSQTNNPSSAALSTRYVPPSSLPSLATLCARVFAKNFRQLVNENHWKDTLEWLKLLPDIMIPKLFAMLITTHPKLLSHGVIATYFLRGHSLSLSDGLGVTSETLTIVPRLMGETLRTLELNDFARFSDATYVSLVSKLPLLEKLVLRNCTKVGPKTAKAIADSCPHLKAVNLNSTSVTPVSLAPLILRCSKLEVLKLAGIQNCTDVTFSKLLTLISEGMLDNTVPAMCRLRSLKLRHNALSDASIFACITQCPVLQRIDLSFTLARHLPNLQNAPQLEKLSLTSTFISGPDLIELVRSLPKLRILSVGAIGIRPGSSSAVMNSTAMTLNDDYLRGLTDALEGCPEIENVNLVQNAKLGTTNKRDSALAYFVRRIGRKCKILNLTGIPSLRSSDLGGLLPEGDHEQISPLHTLFLNKTGIDDDAAPYISSCTSLEVLEVAETKLTAEGLFPIIDACNRLSKLNLTGCRGVKIVDRRRFFEVWDQHQGKS